VAPIQSKPIGINGVEMKVLVTGGAGYIGSHAVKCLLNQGHEVVVLDNLSKGHRQAVDSRAVFVEGDTGNKRHLTGILQAFDIEAVMHFAASIEVGESVLHPGRYYENNVANTIRLLEAMLEEKVNKIVFSSTAAIYGNPATTPIIESHQPHPINPYGRSKWMSEIIIQDFSQAHNFSYAILRYFNVAGAWPDGHIGEDHRPETHLIPRILCSALNGQEPVRIYGTDYPTKDGTCIRDYVHVVDLVEAHLLALENLRSGQGNLFNLGSESGFSVREVISTCEQVTGRQLRILEQERRPGDPAVLIASSNKIRKELGWVRQFPDLRQIVEHAWLWHQKHPKGYLSKETLTIDEALASLQL
jgi:UDP-glucose 4-epimerase